MGFGIIDLGTAWPYAKSVSTVCRRCADADWARLPGPLVAAVATFFAPYAYIWFSAGQMPAGVRAGLVLCVTVLAIAATVGAIAKSRRLRADKVAPFVVPAAEPADIVIDLTGDEAKIIREPLWRKAI